jgi:hypothetical protein
MPALQLYRVEKDKIRGNLNHFTRKAYHMVRGINKPRILENGCGTGVPTLELAMISNGEIDAWI